jgi:hypothetical protein
MTNNTNNPVFHFFHEGRQYRCNVSGAEICEKDLKIKLLSTGIILGVTMVHEMFPPKPAGFEELDTKEFDISAEEIF